MSRPVITILGSRVMAIEPSTGDVLWEHEIDTGGTASAMIITSDLIYAASFRELWCIRYPSGEKVWSSLTEKSGRATLLLEDGRLFIAKVGELECFSLDGKQLWHNKFKGKGVADAALGVPGNVAQADENS